MSQSATIPARTTCDQATEGAGAIFRSLFERSGVCMASLDPGLRVLEANAELLTELGDAGADLRGRRFPELVHPSVQGRLEGQFTRLVHGGHPRFAERVIVPRVDRPALAGELTGIAVPDRAGRPGTIVLLLRPDCAQRPAQVLGSTKLLTAVDARILEGIATGLSTVHLATKLYLSRGGVEYHVASLMRKLKAANRPALVSKAYSMGMLNVGTWPPRVLPDFLK